MVKYIIKRLLLLIPTIFGVITLVFFMIALSPGDPARVMLGERASAEQLEKLRVELGLDKPLLVQYGIYLQRVVRFDLGKSIATGQRITDEIKSRLPATIELAAGSLFFALILAIPIGIVSAVKQHSLLDQFSMAGAFLGISMPAFWLGIILMLLFSVRLRWLPVQGRISYGTGLEEVTGLYVLDSLLTGNRAALISSLKHLVLPSVSLGAGVAAIVARVLRSSMLEVLRQDYITLARAKGQVEFLVVMKHALRNALIPTVTVVGLQVGVLLGGNMIVETVFSWPGLGRWWSKPSSSGTSPWCRAR